LGKKNATYILPIGGLCITYHLLREPETTIENSVPPSITKKTYGNQSERCDACPALQLDPPFVAKEDLESLATCSLTTVDGQNLAKL